MTNNQKPAAYPMMGSKSTDRDFDKNSGSIVCLPLFPFMRTEQQTTNRLDRNISEGSRASRGP